MSRRALAVVALCVVAACAGTSAARVSMDGSISRYLKVEEARLDYIGGVPTAQVTLRSSRGNPLRVKYHFVWFDSDGVQVGTVGGGGLDETFGGLETRVLRGTPPFSGATEYKLVLRHR